MRRFRLEGTFGTLGDNVRDSELGDGKSSASPFRVAVLPKERSRERDRVVDDESERLWLSLLAHEGYESQRCSYCAASLSLAWPVSIHFRVTIRPCLALSR